MSDQLVEVTCCAKSFYSACVQFLCHMCTASMFQHAMLLILHLCYASMLMNCLTVLFIMLSLCFYSLPIVHKELEKDASLRSSLTGSVQRELKSTEISLC